MSRSAFDEPPRHCSASWQPTLSYPPSWRRRFADGALDSSAVQDLLRRAQLPAAELRHMGASQRLIFGYPLPWFPAEEGASLFGRVEWDRHVGDCGTCWTGCATDLSIAAAYGERVLAEHFTWDRCV